MNLELGRSSEPAPRVYDAVEATQPWLQNRHVEEILNNDPRVIAIFEKALQHPTVVTALEQAHAKDAQALVEDLADGLRQSYADLGADCPLTVADLTARAQLPESANGTTGTPRDYFMHRLTGVANIADLSATMTLPPALHESLQREADRLATLLVSMDRADDVTDEAVAA